jgi:hypothetical protein
LLQELFAELPEVVERVDQDQKALTDEVKNREEWEREITYSVKIGAIRRSVFSISPQSISWRQQSFPLAAITRVTWGGVQNSSYIITFGDDRSGATIELNHRETFATIAGKLMMAVGPRLLIDFLRLLKAGTEMQFGEARISDEGVILPKHKTWGSRENLKFGWYDVHVWSGNGAFFIGSKADKRTCAGLSYAYCPNAHILEHAIRTAFDKPGFRVLSGLLKNA